MLQDPASSFAQIMATSMIEDWVREQPQTYRHRATQRFVKFRTHDGLWRLYSGGPRLGSITRRTDTPLQDLHAAIGPETEARIAHWMFWAQIEILREHGDFAGYGWHLRFGQIECRAAHLTIDMPPDIQDDMIGLGVVHGLRIYPFTRITRSIPIPSSAHARMELLQRARATGLS